MTDHPDSTAGNDREPPVPPQPAERDGTKSTAPTPDSPDGHGYIGAYEIIEKIGQGAFGEVFRARQAQPIQRTVALKVLREGRDSIEIVTRFNAERQALALMDHPSIAAVFDAGTTKEGRPFFAMEFIRGEPITTYCDQARLDIVQRLELFAQLCGAVQHAHHKGVIHRDIKPNNVLVTLLDGKPVVKIIDFGIAKALGAGVWGHETLTREGQIVGTPAYMSPEQAKGDSHLLDTRTDIYSLGVLLYELISGALPYGEEEIRKAGVDGWRHLLLEVDPPRPSARLKSVDASTASRTTEVAAKRRETPRNLIRRLNGDLDWIVMRCLEKECSRRYPTASELAADIKRFLADEPVLAGPPTFGYRLRKLIRRRRGALLASAAVAVTALVGVVVATALTVTNMQQASELKAGRVRALLQESRRAAWLDKRAAAEKLAEARALAPGDLDVERELALLPATERNSKEAIALLRRFLELHPRDGEALSFLAGLLAEEAPAEAESLRHRARSRLDAARALFAEGLATTDDARAIDLFTRSLKVYDWNFDAVFQRGVRRFRLEDYKAALEDAELLARLEPRSAQALSLRGSVLDALGRLQEAARDFTLAANTPSPRWTLLYNRCWINYRLENYELALEDARRLEVIDSLPGDVYDLAAWVHSKLNERDAALSAFSRAIAADPGNAAYYRARGDLRLLERQFALAIEDYDQVLKLEPSNVAVRLTRAEAQMQLGKLDLAIGDYLQAQALAPRSAQVQVLLGRTLQKAGRTADALAALMRAVTLEPNNRVWWAELGANHWMNGRDGEARSALQRALGSPETTWVRVWMWDLLMRSGRVTEASGMITAANAELDSELMSAAVEVLAGGELPPQPPSFVRTTEDQLYWHFTLGTAAFARGDRARAKQEYKAITDLGDVRDTEVDIAAWRLRTL